MPDLLIELFSEEIPARMQARASADLQRLMTDGLVEAGLTYAVARAYATPRRLALHVEGVSGESPTTREERKGPRADAPEKAIAGFLRATGLSLDELERRDSPKGDVYFATIVRPGRPASDIVADVLEATIRGFPWPKSMRWGGADSSGAGTLRWVRPLRRILCLLSDESGTQVVPLRLDGFEAGDVTEGHRFMAPAPFAVTGFDDYAAALKRAHVILDPAERAETIWHDATTDAFARGLEVIEDKGLLAEVAGLVEWPVVLMGEIGAAFLDLPAEVLQTSMKEHQKFFSVRNPRADRITHFITVANRETADNGATILAGNRKVLAARLADAKFFWENDLRVAHDGMGAWIAKLEDVTFERRLGSQADRIARIAALAREIAPAVGADPDLAEQAAGICKADLASEMVYEFPELQGIMGRHYALAAGRPEAVAAACEEHYKPLGPSDSLPENAVSQAVALADKIDLLTGFWAIDEKPTGSKDPYALRRAALGVIRIVLGTGARLHLDRFVKAQLLRHALHEEAQEDAESRALVGEMIDEIARHGVFGAAMRAVLEGGEDAPEAVARIGKTLPDTAADLRAFLHDRLKVHLRDEGIRHDVIDACLATEGADDLTLLVARARALNAELATPDGENLIQGFKRAANILAQAEAADGVAYEYGPDPKFAETDEERALFAALDAADREIGPALAAEDFTRAMSAMAALRAPIDAFFDAVQVNTDNQIVRRNRLNLLHRIRETCLQAADLTKLDG
ncbi:MAG: glycine--tRNA ligase subunit beta [Pseudomonadota bacterium]